MGCCFCCLDEGEKVELVLKKFQPVRASQAMDGMLMKLIGRVILAGTQPFYAPATGKPCVYWHVVVEEERIHHHRHEHRDADGHIHVEHTTTHEWAQIFNGERFTDFYLVDGDTRIFINGSNRNQCKVQSTRSERGGTSIFTCPPPGIAQIIAEREATFSWSFIEGRTGRFRYSQSSFDVNELVAALGVIAPAHDPYGGGAVKQLLPIRGDVLNEQFFKDQKWEDWDIRSWQDLVQTCPSVLLSDDPMFTSGVGNQIPIVQSLPAWQLQIVQVPASYPAPAGAAISVTIPAGAMPQGYYAPPAPYGQPQAVMTYQAPMPEPVMKPQQYQPPPPAGYAPPPPQGYAPPPQGYAPPPAGAATYQYQYQYTSTSSSSSGPQVTSSVSYSGASAPPPPVPYGAPPPGMQQGSPISMSISVQPGAPIPAPRLASYQSGPEPGAPDFGSASTPLLPKGPA